jgi:hypothetical protein
MSGQPERAPSRPAYWIEDRTSDRVAKERPCINFSSDLHNMCSQKSVAWDVSCAVVHTNLTRALRQAFTYAPNTKHINACFVSLYFI